MDHRTGAKNGVEHIVPLSDAALNLVNGAPAIAGGYVFTTTGKTPISGYSKWKARLDAVVTELNGGEPIPHWTLHDLRRTFSSGWARLRIPREITEKAINHTSGSFGGVAGIYDRHEYEVERCEAMEAWSRHVLSLIETGPVNVVPLRATAS